MMRALRIVRPLFIALVVAGALVGGGLFVQEKLPVVPEVQAVSEPIGSLVLICPEPGANAELGVRVTAAVVPGLPGQGGDGGAAGLETLPGPASAKADISAPGGQVQIDAFGEKLPPIRGVGVGSLAPGFVADQWGRDPRGSGRGLASTACGPAASDFWFVGGGSVAGAAT